MRVRREVTIICVYMTGNDLLELVKDKIPNLRDSLAEVKSHGIVLHVRGDLLDIGNGLRSAGLYINDQYYVGANDDATIIRCVPENSGDMKATAADHSQAAKLFN